MKVRHAKSESPLKRSIAFALATLLLFACGGCDKKPPKKPEWDPEVVKVFENLPVQDLGRIKPLGTVAGFKLLKINGKRTCYPWGGDVDGSQTLAPVPWLLDVIFFPEIAKTYPVFVIDNAEVLDAIGVAHDASKGKRGRYAFADIEPGMDKLSELFTKYAQIKDADRTGLEEQIVQLGHNVSDYQSLAHFLDFARAKYPLRGSDDLAHVFGPTDSGLAVFLAKADEVRAAFQKASPQSQQAFRALLDEVEENSRRAMSLILFPPSRTDDKQWLSPGQLVEARFKTDERLGTQIALLGTLEVLEQKKNDPAAFKAALDVFASGVEKLAAERGEYRKVPLEVAFYKADFFFRALYAFGFSFILVAFSWLFPANLLKKGSIALLGLGTVLLVAGIVLRCVIRARPPVSTLYETILFISAVAVIVAIVIEWINRQGIAIALAPLLGAMGMFLANKYEFKESVTNGDTMTSLQAVLDTNFWLATHVTSVTTGYSAGLLAAAIAHVWLLGKLVGYRAGDDKFYKSVARMTYGVLCFGLFFSTVGTILGGIWANYSWGRFWGWDPKENGALMIVLWELGILHARLGGYVRDYGLCVLAVLGGLVIGFSWWGVNLLGVGLHSYGFTTGVLQILVTFYVVELAVVAASGFWWFSQRFAIVSKAAEDAKPAGPTPSDGGAPQPAS